jgi:hypothetical protein
MVSVGTEQLRPRNRVPLAAVMRHAHGPVPARAVTPPSRSVRRAGTPSTWSELRTRGFVTLRSFFSSDEIDELRRAYHAHRATESLGMSNNRARGTSFASSDAIARIRAKVSAALGTIRAETGMCVDYVEDEGTFFATEQTGHLGWHTDHKIAYVHQSFRDHLSLWIPITKPVRNKSGLALVPMDRLREHAPEVYACVHGKGAASYRDGIVRYEDDGRRRAVRCPINLDDIAETPDTVPGDLVVRRGDVLHRTQDTETDRIAVALSAHCVHQIIDVRTLLTGSAHKHQVMIKERTHFSRLLACFLLHRKRRISVAEARQAHRALESSSFVPAITHLVAQALFPLAVLWNRITCALTSRSLVQAPRWALAPARRDRARATPYRARA